MCIRDRIYCYQGRVINPSAYLKRGIDATSVCGAAAAAVTAGTMLGLDTAPVSYTHLFTY